MVKKRITMLEERSDGFEGRIRVMAERIENIEKKLGVISEHIKKLHNNFDDTFKLLEKIINEQLEGCTDGKEQ